MFIADNLTLEIMLLCWCFWMEIQNLRFNFYKFPFIKFINFLGQFEAMHLIEGLSYNTQLAKETKFDLIDKYYKAPVVNNFDTNFKYNLKCNLIIFDSLIRLEYYDQELWDILLENLITRKFIKKIEDLRNLYETLDDLRASGNFYRDLTPEVEHFKNIFMTKPDLVWRYKCDEKRMYTYQELKAKREDCPEQKLTRYFDPKMLEVVIEEKIITDESRNREFDELIKTRYISLLRGETREFTPKEEEEMSKYEEKLISSGKLDDVIAKVPGLRMISDLDLGGKGEDESEEESEDESEDEVSHTGKTKEQIKMEKKKKGVEVKTNYRIDKILEKKEKFGYLDIDLKDIHPDKTFAKKKKK